MSTIKIKFLEPGKWMDEPHKPIFEVAAGEEKEVSARLAKIATDAGRAEFVRPKQKPGPKPKAEADEKKPGPKAKSESGPKAKAET
jgi:hypothetical protein